MYGLEQRCIGILNEMAWIETGEIYSLKNKTHTLTLLPHRH